MRKVFVDIYLMYNLGDDLFLDILSRKFPDCQFTVNYLGKQYDTFLNSYSNVNRRKYTILNKIGQKLKLTDNITNYEEIAEEHDALLFIGGSIFREEEYHKDLYRDRMEIIRNFKNKEKPVFILGANFGPYKTEMFLNDYRELFALCDDVCFRDTYSFDLFKDLPQVRCYPDIVFQLNVKEYINVPKKKMVGYSIIDLTHKQDLVQYEEEYLSSTAKSIELMTEAGYECLLMSFCENEGDLRAIRKIRELLPQHLLHMVHQYEYEGDLHGAMRLIGSLDLVIAARFHANILALLLGIGVLPVIYSIKTINMLDDLGLGDFYVEMENLTALHDLTTLHQAMGNTIDLADVVMNSRHQFSALQDFLSMEVV